MCNQSMLLSCIFSHLYQLVIPSLLYESTEWSNICSVLCNAVGYIAFVRLCVTVRCPDKQSQTRFLACFVFSSLSGHAPSYLADDIHLVSEGHRRRLRFPPTDRVPFHAHTTHSVTGASLSPGHVFGTVFRVPAHLRDEDIINKFQV